MSSTAATFTSTGINYTATGLQFETAKGSAILHPNGTESFEGTGRYTGGTGAFKGLRGSYTFTGSAPKAPAGVQPVVTLHIKGNLRY